MTYIINSLAKSEVSVALYYYRHGAYVAAINRAQSAINSYQGAPAQQEALAIIAYKQPMTRAQVASIRGVNSDGVIRSLTVRGLVQEHGADPQTHAALLETTGLFLEYMGLDSLDDLPSLAPFLPADAGQVVREAAGEHLGAL